MFWCSQDVRFSGGGESPEPASAAVLLAGIGGLILRPHAHVARCTPPIRSASCIRVLTAQVNPLKQLESEIRTIVSGALRFIGPENPTREQGR